MPSDVLGCPERTHTERYLATYYFFESCLRILSKQATRHAAPHPFVVRWLIYLPAKCWKTEGTLRHELRGYGMRDGRCVDGE